jgi:membrane protein
VANSTVAGRAGERYEQTRPLGVLGETLKKFRQDRSTRLAAMMAFWAFFSVFPLFLLFVSVLGYVLPGSTKAHVLHHVAAFFPLLDPSTVGHLSGNLWSALLGGVTALWSGTAVMRTAEFAFNTVWRVPLDQRPKTLRQLLHAIEALATIGVGLVASTIISGYVTGRSTGVHLGLAGRAGGYAVAAVLDVGLFVAAFRMLTDRELSSRDVLPGAVLSGVAFWVLEQVSSFIISNRLQHAQPTYGHFATVITVLWWFYIEAVITLLGAQLNVVLHGRRPSGLTA